MTENTQAVPLELPNNAVALMDSTQDTLTIGKLYAIKDPVKYSDDPQLILTEDLFRSAIPDGFYTVEAVGPRHFVPHQYEITTDLEPGEITGFTPEFNVTEALEPHPSRARHAAALGNPRDRLIQNRAQTLQRENQVAAKALTPGSESPEARTSLLPSDDDGLPTTLE